MVPNKSSLVQDNKTSGHTTVTFQLDDANESEKKTTKKQQTRKEAAEPFVHQEIQSWSSFFGSSNCRQDHPHNHINQQADKPSLQPVSIEDPSLPPNDERSNRNRSALIGRKKYHYHNHATITCDSFFGTMPDLNQILTNPHFLRRLPYLKALITFIDSCLRGIGQVMFANNSLSGLVITIGLLIGQWQLALCGLFGTIISTLTAHLLGLDYGSIRAGLYGYNGCLTAMAITHFSYDLDLVRMIGSIVLMSACSTVFFLAISKVLVIQFGISSFTFSSQLCSILWLFAARKFRNFFVDELLLTPGLLATTIARSNPSNETTLPYSLLSIFADFCTSVSQVYFLDNVSAGIIILVGVLICSPILSLLALFGAVTGQLSAAYLFRLPTDEIQKGLWGYNSVSTCQALGGMFFLLSGFRIWIYTLFGSIMTVVAQAAISVFFFPLGMSAMLLPSTLISWLFCLMAGSSENMTPVELRSISTPEDHLRRFRLTRHIKRQLEFIQNLPTILQKTGRYKSISIEDLAKIEAELVPILLCSFAHQKDVRNLKKLLQKGANVNSTDYDLRSPLHIAACDGDSDLCFMLIARFHANVNLLDDFGGTSLYDAFCHGNFHLIPFLYAHGARMPACKAKELTFYLCGFSFEGNLEAVQYLLACGVNPNLTDYDGRTALHLAVCGNHLSIVQYLVEIANASLSIADYYGQTPVDDAQRLPDTNITSYFQHERNGSLKQKPRSTIIRVEKIIDDSDTEDEAEEVEEDLGDSTVTNVEEKLLPAIFCMAAAAGDIRQMASILQQFPDFHVDSVDYDFRSAAHIAAAEGQLLSMRFLYDYCNSKDQDLQWLNREDRWGCTPTEEAYRRGHYVVAHYLKRHTIKKAEPESLDMDELSMGEKMMLAMRKWKKILYFATLASNNEAELIKGLLASEVFSSSVFYADYDGRTPMHLAAANGHIEVVKVLQNYGDTGRIHRDRWGNCAVDEARRKKFDHIVDILLEDIV